jgi:hypothetical protein
MTARCPSDLALESLLLDPRRSPAAPHVDACPRCRARLAAMEEQGEEFRRFVFPATVEAVEDAAERRRPRLAFLFAPVGAFAALAAALLLFVKTQDGGPAAERAGEGCLRFGAFVSADGSPRPLQDGAVVPASAAIGFNVNIAGGEECYLWILSVDAKGEIARIHPPKGTPATRHWGGPIPGRAVLDGSEGPERIFAVCAPPDMPWNDVRRSAAPAAAGPGSVRSAGKLAEPLAGADQVTILVEKRP